MVTVNYANGMKLRNLIEQLEVMEQHDARLVGCAIKFETAEGNFINVAFPDEDYVKAVQQQG
jgi:hypothetical protein